MSGLQIDGKRDYRIQVERSDIAWWVVHVYAEDDIVATLSARELAAALTAVAAVIERELSLV